MLSRGFLIHYRTVCFCNGLFEGLSAPKVLRRLIVCPSLIATLIATIWNPWTYTSRITACFGRHALWGSLVSSALPSLQCPIWPPSLLQFTWLLSRILQWMARRHLLVYVSQSRLQRLPLLLGVWFAYWFRQPSALCGASYDGLSLPAWECSRFSFNAAIRLSSISCAPHWLALAAVLRCWHIWKLFQPQFPHRRCNGCRL